MNTELIIKNLLIGKLLGFDEEFTLGLMEVIYKNENKEKTKNQPQRS